VVLAAAVMWMLLREDAGSAGLNQQKATATTQPQAVVVSDHPVVGEFSIPNNSAMGPTLSKQPNQILPTTTANSKSNNTPTGMERLHLILTSSGSVGFAERVRDIRSIQASLTATEMEAFSRYLQTPVRDSQRSDGENWLRNTMLDALVQQRTLVPGLAGSLVALYQDISQDPVMRDYAIQHMAPIYDRVSPEEQAGLRNALWQATGEVGNGIAGTALLALLNVSETDSTIDLGHLGETAFKLAVDDNTGELARITAVQVCGRLGVQKALRDIEQFAQQSPSMPLRIAATAALGDYAMMDNNPGSADAGDLLANLAQSSDSRQAVAVEAARRRIARTRSSLARRTEP
jgi:hypothetical protein